MKWACEDVIGSHRDLGIPTDKANVTLVTPPGFKRPKGFPRGYLLQVKDDGRRIWHFPASRLLVWLNANLKEAA